jgi:hypothetical protein
MPIGFTSVGPWADAGIAPAAPPSSRAAGCERLPSGWGVDELVSVEGASVTLATSIGTPRDHRGLATSDRPRAVALVPLISPIPERLQRANGRSHSRLTHQKMNLYSRCERGIQ